MSDSPTATVMRVRRQHSDAHVFEDTGLYTTCGRCYMPWDHPNHVTREEDRDEVRRMRDRVDSGDWGHSFA